MPVSLLELSQSGGNYIEKKALQCSDKQQGAVNYIVISVIRWVSLTLLDCGQVDANTFLLVFLNYLTISNMFSTR